MVGRASDLGAEQERIDIVGSPSSTIEIARGAHLSPGPG
jgi:hypothetical protein